MRARRVGDGDEPLFAMLSDATPGARRRSCPTPAWGSSASACSRPILITGDDYGTRASTVLRAGRDGRARFEERTRDASGAVTSAAAFDFPFSPEFAACAFAPAAPSGAPLPR